jgi:hypothetical protein
MDLPLPCTLAFHPTHLRLISTSNLFLFLGFRSFCTWHSDHTGFPQTLKKLDNRNAVLQHSSSSDEAGWTPIVPIPGRCICLIPLCAAAGTPRKALHSLKSTLSQDIIAQQLSMKTPAGRIPCQHSVDTVTAQQMKIVCVHVSVLLTAILNLQCLTDFQLRLSLH